MNVLLALAPIQAWSIADFLIAVVIVAAAVGILYLALQYFGIAIPPVIIKIFWIVIVACVAILAIRFVASL